MERQAYRIRKAGNLKNLNRVTETLAAPEAGEVTVEVHSIGLNFADIFAMLGLYSATPEGSFVPGLEYSGIVVARGEGDHRLAIGDRVMGVTRFGGYASHLNIDADYVVPLPDGWTFAEGAAFPVQALTAYYGLYVLGDLRPGMTVLIHSAAGGVGIWANRMAKKTGAYTIGTVGNSSKSGVLEEEGYDDWLVRDKQFGKKLDGILNGRKLDLAMECIGGQILKEGYKRLGEQGRMVIYGSARYGGTSSRPDWPRLIWLYLTRPKIDPQKMIEENKGILGFNLIWLYDRKKLMHDILGRISALDLEKPRIGYSFEFEELAEAIRLFQGGSTTGKVIINVKH